MTAPVSVQCGTNSRSGARFCVNCGAIQVVPKLFFRVLGRSVIIWLLIFLGLLLFGGKDKTPIRSVKYPIMLN